jgi:DJ-1/PfpI family
MRGQVSTFIIDTSALLLSSLGNRFMTDSPQYTLGLIFYPGMTSLDIIGPQQVLSPLPGIKTYRIWKTLFLAKAGLLEGYRAASHWAGRPQLAALGVDFSTERVVVDRNRITGGGVTAGIDFGLTIASILFGEEIAKITQLLLEYDPAPPFDTGSPEKAGPELVEKAILFMQQMIAPVGAK